MLGIGWRGVFMILQHPFKFSFCHLQQNRHFLVWKTHGTQRKRKNKPATFKGRTALRFMALWLRNRITADIFLWVIGKKQMYFIYRYVLLHNG